MSIRPVLYLDYSNARRTYRDDIDLVRLALISNGESQIGQENPFSLSLEGRQSRLQSIEGSYFTPVGGRAAVAKVDFHGVSWLGTRSMAGWDELVRNVSIRCD